MASTLYQYQLNKLVQFQIKYKDMIERLESKQNFTKLECSALVQFNKSIDHLICDINDINHILDGDVNSIKENTDINNIVDVLKPLMALTLIVKDINNNN